MSRLPGVLFHSDLPEAELHAAKLDGELYPVDQCFSPIDTIEGRWNRARALLLTVPARLIAEQRTAAWIYGAGPVRGTRKKPRTLSALQLVKPEIDFVTQ